MLHVLGRARRSTVRAAAAVSPLYVLAGAVGLGATTVSVPVWCDDEQSSKWLARSSASVSRMVRCDEHPNTSSAFARAAMADARTAAAFARGVAKTDMTDFLAIIRRCRMDSRGTVFVSGVGKSGMVAKRMASSLCSIGISASYVHGTEWVHGELGVLRPGDCIICFANSGETREMVELMKYCRAQDRGVKTLVVVGKPNSSMEALADAALVHPSIPVDSPELIGKVPTRSIIMQEMAVNAIVTAMAEVFGVDAATFLRNRPGGPGGTAGGPASLWGSQSGQNFRSSCSDFAGSAAADATAAKCYADVMPTNLTPFIESISTCRGTIHVTGVGKSGLVANRMTISLMSIGRPASYVHATEWVHGDLGVLRDGDCIVAFSQSGETHELLDLMATCHKQNRDVKLLAVVGHAGSSMDKLAHHVMVLPSIPSSSPELHGGIPMRSIIMQEMVVNGVLTELVESASFGPTDFLRNHPGGSIGTSK